MDIRAWQDTITDWARARDRVFPDEPGVKTAPSQLCVHPRLELYAAVALYRAFGSVGTILPGKTPSIRRMHAWRSSRCDSAGPVFELVVYEPEPRREAA